MVLACLCYVRPVSNTCLTLGLNRRWIALRTSVHSHTVDGTGISSDIVGRRVLRRSSVSADRNAPHEHALTVRYGEHFAPPEGTIAAHLRVIENHGFVWFGKMGSPMARARIEVLNRQIVEGTPTYLVLVRARANGRTVHLCRISDMSRERPTDEASIPAYYRSRPGVGVWIRLTSIQSASPAVLAKLQVSSSSSPLTQTLAASAKSFFYVTGPSGWAADGEQ